MRTPKPRFVLHLEAEPRGDDSTGMRRLRAVLKLLLRSFGFRCRWIEYPPEPGPPDDDYAYPLKPEGRTDG